MPQKMPCKVTDVISHGGRVYTVLLRPERRLPRFAAGQFLHLALDPFRPGDYWPDSRVFSIASSPAEAESLRITYAVKGQFTSRMEKELHPDCQVWIKMPYGEFEVAQDKDICLLAGGTGITAFTAFLAQLQPTHAHKVQVFYGARTPDLLIYREVVESAGARCKNVFAHLFSEKCDGADSNVMGGRLDLAHIAPLIRCRLADRTYYLAGPPAMIQGLSTGLQATGVPASQLNIDAWE
jgi:ferredoxin-NADP reductase